MDVESEAKLDGWLKEFSRALSAHRADVVAEVRDDVEARVDAAVRRGAPPGEALARALADLGDPAALAVEIDRARPPAQAPWVRSARALAAVGIAAFGLSVAWHVRPWSYGLQATAAAATCLLLHASFALCVAPGLVWRRNALFAPALGLGAVAMTLALATLGRGSEATGGGALPLSFGAAETTFFDLELARSSADDLAARTYVMAAVLTLVVVALLALLQRPRQRWALAAGLVAAFAVVELPHRMEERAFREDVQRAVLALEVHGRALDEAASEHPEDETSALLAALELSYRGSRDHYVLRRERAWMPSCGLAYDSRSRRITGHD
ncbi:MAG: permease prefix domain 1-containing protein [Planctomycetota bacterium]